MSAPCPTSAAHLRSILRCCARLAGLKVEIVLRLVLVTSLVLAAVAAPATAHADGPSPQLSFLARFAIDLTTTRLTVEDEFLIRLPGADTEAAPASPTRLALPGQSRDVIALLGAGLDLGAADAEETTPVLLQFKPTFARRGGVLRCTFRF